MSTTAKRTGVIVGSAEGFPAGPGYAPFGSHRVEVLEQYLPPGYLVRELNSGTLLFEGDDPERGPRLEACLIPLAQAGLTVRELEHLVDDLPCAGCHGRVTTYLPTHYGKMAPPVWCEECTRWKRNHGA